MFHFWILLAESISITLIFVGSSYNFAPIWSYLSRDARNLSGTKCVIWKLRNPINQDPSIWLFSCKLLSGSFVCLQVIGTTYQEKNNFDKCKWDTHMEEYYMRVSVLGCQLPEKTSKCLYINRAIGSQRAYSSRELYFFSLSSARIYWVISRKRYRGMYDSTALLLILVAAAGTAVVHGHAAANTPAVQFWKQVLPDSPMPEAIDNLVQKGRYVSTSISSCRVLDLYYTWKDFQQTKQIIHI